MTLAEKDDPIIPMNNDAEEQEETLWRHDIKKGWIRKKVVYSYLISNKRVVSGTKVLNLDDVSNCVSANEERFYGGGANKVGTRTRGVNARLSSYRGRGRVIGDVIFTSPSSQDIIFHDVPDPDGLVRLVKSIMKARKERRKEQKDD
jgi:hypothetical protein